MTSPDRLQRLLTVPVDLDLKSAFTRAWELYRAHALFFSLYMLFILSIQGMVVIYVQAYMIVYSVLLAPPLYAGFYLVANKLSRGEPIIYPDFFGSNEHFWLRF